MRPGDRAVCPTGKPAYATKREAQAAFPGRPVTRCGRCRRWHLDGKAKGGRR